MAEYYITNVTFGDNALIISFLDPTRQTEDSQEETTVTVLSRNYMSLIEAVHEAFSELLDARDVSFRAPPETLPGAAARVKKAKEAMKSIPDLADDD